MSDRPETTRPELPPGFAVHNDGPDREVLFDSNYGDIAHVFGTRAAAAAAAWEWWDSVYADGAS